MLGFSVWSALLANFRTHLAAGLTGSVAATAAVMQSGAVTGIEASILFVLGMVAALLPDIDSDHSIPIRLLFTLFSIMAALAVVMIYYGSITLPLLICAALASALTVRFILMPLFAAMTEHRGLFHSLPMALLFGLGTFFAAMSLDGCEVAVSQLAGIFVTGGYLIHLLLDELYSVNFTGVTIKGSFGTAMTIFSREQWLSYLLLYGAVATGWIIMPLLNPSS